MSFDDLPSLTRLFNRESCISKHENPCTCTENKKKKTEKKLETDKRLMNWEEWMAKRKQIHRKLGELLERESGSLLMNATEELRKVKEDKLVMEYTKILTPPDPQRGSPAFWKMPVGLVNTCDRKLPSCYFAAKTSEDKCIIPTIEHVGIPDLIYEEKDVLPRTRNVHELWKSISYRNERTAELNKKIQLVEPHKPDTKQLMIVGKCLDKPSEPLEEQLEETIEEKKTESPKQKSQLCIILNGLKVSPETSSDLKPVNNIRLQFDYDINCNQVVAQYLIMENSGTTALRFHWHPFIKPPLFQDVKPTTKSIESNFFFNKCEGIIIPRQVINFPFWFKTDKPGTYSESWEITTCPKIWLENQRVVIILQAYAVTGDLESRFEGITEKLENRVRDRLIKETLSEVLSNIVYDKPALVVYRYDKAQLFEARNSEFDAFHNHPKYLYDKVIVEELEEFYKTVRSHDDPVEWNYLIDDLRATTKRREFKIDAEANEFALQEANKRREEKEKQKLEAQKVDSAPNKSAKGKRSPKPSKEKKSTPKGGKGKEETQETFEEKIDYLKKENTLSQQLEALVGKLEMPAVYVNLEKEKYATAYMVLFSHIVKLCEEINILEDDLDIIIDSLYPTFRSDYEKQIPSYRTLQRLIHEYYRQTSFEGPKSIPITKESKQDKLAPEILKEIPWDDSKKVYKTYYGLPDTPPPESKGKKGKKGKGGKKDKGGKKSKSSASDKGKKDKKNKKDKGEKDKGSPKKIDDGYDHTIKANFDAFDEYYKTPSLSETSDVTNDAPEETAKGESKRRLLDQYKYNLYLIFYRNLCNAVEDVVDVVEMFKDSRIRHAAIKTIEDSEGVHEAYRKHVVCHVDLKRVLSEWHILDQKPEKPVIVESEDEVGRPEDSVQSLWSLLQPQTFKPKFYPKSPVSYPQPVITSYEDLKLQTSSFVNVSTSTLEHGVLDKDWQDFKQVGIQKDNGEENLADNFETKIEIPDVKTSVQELVLTKSVACQKNLDEHISDENMYYNSDDESSSSETEDFCNCENRSCETEGSLSSEENN